MPKPATQARRAYNSPTRRARAEQTERRIVDAAASLLRDKGWAGTTLSDVADEAGVSSAMLYKAFRTKADLVKRVYDVTLVGDQADVPFRERPEFRAVLDDPDPASKVAGYAHLMRLVAERILPVYEQIRAAATAGDEDLAPIADTADTERLFGARGIVADLRAMGALGPGVQEARAVDLVWMAMSPEFWSLLLRRGWSWDEAETWVAGHLCAILLG